MTEQAYATERLLQELVAAHPTRQIRADFHWSSRATLGVVMRGRKAKRSSKAAASAKRAYRVEQADPRALEIQAVLEEDLANGARLMQPEYRKYALRHRVLDGYCAAAAAAYFHLEPGDDPRAAGLQPMQVNHADGSHWWISRRDGDEEVIVDLTLRRTDKPTFNYSTGGPRGFTNAGYRKPPKRAAEIIKRVRARA